MFSFASRGDTHSVRITLQNDGTLEDSFTIRGGRNTKDFQFRCFEGNNDITEKILKGGYLTPVLKPGKTLRIRVEVTCLQVRSPWSGDFFIRAISRTRPQALDTAAIHTFIYPF